MRFYKIIFDGPMYQFNIITIFPQIISDYSKISIIARAIKKKLIGIQPVDLRDFAADAHKTVDDRPYGGGVGMVLRPDILYKAIAGISGAKNSAKRKNSRVILLSPQGKKFMQKDARRLAAKYSRIVFVCGRYEGFDERARKFADEEFSVGDYILMGGELPALVMVEAISRFVPGVVGKFESTQNESFAENAGAPPDAPAAAGVKFKYLLEYPQYTRPEVLKLGRKQLKVPKVLLSGNHKKINDWRLREAIKRTKKRRPDLLNLQDEVKS